MRGPTPTAIVNKPTATPSNAKPCAAIAAARAHAERQAGQQHDRDHRFGIARGGMPEAAREQPGMHEGGEHEGGGFERQQGADSLHGGSPFYGLAALLTSFNPRPNITSPAVRSTQALQAR